MPPSSVPFRSNLALPPRAVLVGVEFTGRTGRPAGPAHPQPAVTAEASLVELRALAESAGATVVELVLQRRSRPDAATLIGAGKLTELTASVAAANADLVVVDTELSPTQQRNLEHALRSGGSGHRGPQAGASTSGPRAAGARGPAPIKVLDRTQLILDIFARHARTREGQLQVELAQLEYLLPRLAGQGHRLSRLGGGIGTRGPGETQLETDRRRIHSRIRQLHQALERVRAQRGQQRRLREAVPLATVALVGYTNAGKSTLFNRLTGAAVLSSARMFATLDPTLRALRLPSHRRVLLSDTVGFLRDLPHGLISAFRATLEEVTRASLLLVVSDASAPEREAQERQVDQVLEELGVGATPRVRVWNKADRLAQPPAFPELAGASPPLLVSALTGAGVPGLLARIDADLPFDPLEQVRLRIPHPAGRLLHLLHERGEILAQHHANQRVELVARVPASLLPALRPYRVRERTPSAATVEKR